MASRPTENVCHNWLLKLLSTLSAPATLLLLLLAASAAAVDDDTGVVHFTSQPQDVHVLNGSRVQLICSTIQRNEGEDVIVWKHNDIILSVGSNVFFPNRGISVSIDDTSVTSSVTGRVTVTSVLVIESASTDNEGVYECQIPSLMLSQTSRVTVNYGPSISLFFPDTVRLDLPIGEILHLECRASGKPQPNITWTFQSTEQQQSVDVVLKQTSQPISSIVVDEASVRDHGVYACTADNGVGVANRQIKVNILFSPILSAPSDVIRVSYNSDVTLECFCESNPASSITWTQNNVNVNISHYRNPYVRHNTRRLNETTVVSTIRIRQLQLSDVGYYACMAKNPLGQATVHLTVTGLPEDLSIVSDNVSQYSDQYTLRWMVRSLSEIIDAQLLLSGSSPLQNYSFEGALAVQPLKIDDRDSSSLSSSSQQKWPLRSMQYFYHILGSLKPSTLYKVSLRTRNAFGYSNWTDFFYFETAHAGRSFIRQVAAQQQQQQQPINNNSPIRRNAAEASGQSKAANSTTAVFSFVMVHALVVILVQLQYMSV